MRPFYSWTACHRTVVTSVGVEKSGNLPKWHTSETLQLWLIGSLRLLEFSSVPETRTSKAHLNRSSLTENMNKRPNPFFPQQAAYSNPPLPPGIPPQQPQQYDYSAYWAAAQASQQSAHPQSIPQWTPPQPTSGPSGASSQVPANQTSLYANYGYGGQQNFNWQRPAQQPPRQPFAIPQGVTQSSQPYFPQQQQQQQQHPPSTQPGRAFPSQPAQSFPQPSQPYRPQQPMFHQHQQPPPPQHTPPHLPPAKRARFEGPLMAHPTSIGSGPNGSGHGVGRGGSNGVPNSFGTGRGSGQSSGPGARGAPQRGRGGTMGIGGGPSIGMMRGGALNNVAARGGRGGHNSNGRGSHNMGQSGGHRGGRGGWHNQNNHNRRGAPGSGGRGRGSGHTHSNHARDVGMARFNAPNAGEKERSGKKEEVRQTLTDFRIVGLEFETLQWRWGSCTSSDSVDDDSKVAEPVGTELNAAIGDSLLPLTDGVEEIEFGSAVKVTGASTTSETPVPPPKIQSTSKSPSDESPTNLGSLLPGPPPPSPPRIRIYFNTPASLDDSQPKVANGASTVSANRAKRKLSEEEEEEGRRRRTKLNPTSEAEEVSFDGQSKVGEVEKDRDSVAPSVDMSATASVSGRTEDEGDWLMEAIGRDIEATEDEIQEEQLQQSDGEVNTEVGAEPDGEIAEPDHTKEDAPSNDTDTTVPLELTVDIEDTDVQDHITVNGQHEKEVPAPESASTGSSGAFPATHMPDNDEDVLPPQNVITVDTPSHRTEANNLQMDSGPEPEPPASPASQSASQQSLSQTLHSSGGSFSSLASPSNSQATTLAASSQIPGLTVNETVSHQYRLPSPNRISISYASGARRLLIDAQVVEALKIWRGQGRIQVVLSLEREGDRDLKGLLVSSILLLVFRWSLRLQ